MNRVAPSEQPGVDIDELLRDFFKGETPTPWPAPPARPRRLTLARRIGSTRRRPLFDSRLSLAASVALLLFTAWLLSERSQPSARGPDLPVRLGPPSSSLKNIKPGAPVPPAPEVKPEKPALPILKPANKKEAGKVKSSLTLRQGKDGYTSIGATVVEPSPPGK